MLVTPATEHVLILSSAPALQLVAEAGSGSRALWSASPSDLAEIRGRCWQAIWIDLDAIAQVQLSDFLPCLAELDPVPQLVLVTTSTAPYPVDRIVDPSLQPDWRTRLQQTLALPPFDAEGFLDRMMGNEELAQKVMRLFLDDTPRLLSALSDAATTGDAGEAMRLAHSIKGSAMNVGADALVECAALLEARCRDGVPPGIPNQIARLERQFAALRPTLEAFAS